MLESTDPLYFQKERANTFTHGIGIPITLVAAYFLVQLGIQQEASKPQLIGLSIFCLSLFLQYLVSTIYHSTHDSIKKVFWRKMDHVAIYFLIAGTHTPFVFSYLDNTKGMIYLLVLWSLGLIGALGKLFFLGKWERLSLFLYIFMGWMVLFILPDLLEVMNSEVLLWIGIGGFFYTTGVLFFVWERLKYNHAIWHLFVLAGSAGHYLALWKVFDP